MGALGGQSSAHSYLFLNFFLILKNHSFSPPVSLEFTFCFVFIFMFLWGGPYFWNDVFCYRHTFPSVSSCRATLTRGPAYVPRLGIAPWSSSSLNLPTTVLPQDLCTCSAGILCRQNLTCLTSPLHPRLRSHVTSSKRLSLTNLSETDPTPQSSTIMWSFLFMALNNCAK